MRNEPPKNNRLKTSYVLIRTTILIAHRISTVEQMDRIIFLEDGAVTAVGTHQELYEGCPAYHHMVELQKLEEEGKQHNA